MMKQYAHILVQSRLSRTASLLLVIAVVAFKWFWDKPEVLRQGFLGLIVIGTAIAALATYEKRNPWILFGAIVSAMCGFGASYFGDVASGKKANALETKLGVVSKELSHAREDMKVLIAATELKDRSLELGKDEIRNRLETLHQRLFDSLPEDAEVWAKKFIEIQPIREKEIHTRDQERRDEYRRQAPRIPIVFRFMLSMFDERMQALAKKMKGVEIAAIGDLPEELLIQAGKKSHLDDMKIRKVKLPNGRSIEASITQGEWTGGIITEYPSFYLTELPRSNKPQTRQIEFGLRSVTLGSGPIPYPLQGDPVVTDEFRERLGKLLDQMLSAILARDPIQ